MFDGAFNALLALHSRPVTLKRLGTPDLVSPIRITPSNYFRNQEGPGSTIIEGREFIISKAAIKIKFTPLLKRGDKIIDPELGTMAIDSIEEMYDLGGSIMGFRVTIS